MAGTYEPDTSTTGTIPGATLTALTGDQTITAAGTVIEDRDITGRVIVQAANVTIRNCRVRGSGAQSSNTALVVATHGAVSNLLVEDCTLVPDTPSIWWNGINGHDFTAKRVNAYHVVDGMGVYNTNAPGAASGVLIEACYIHDLSYFTPDQNHAGTDNQTHNDGVQLQGGLGTIIRHNRIDAYYATAVGTVGSIPPNQTGALAAIMLNKNVGTLTDLQITDNWLRGGNIGVNGGGLARAAGEFLGIFYRNRFSRDQGLQGGGGNNTWTVAFDGSYPSSAEADAGEGTANQNVYESNGDPVTVRRNA